MSIVENLDISYFNDVSSNISFNNFNIFSLNIRSLRNKKDKLEDFLALIDVKISVVIISETWLNATESKMFEIKGYNSFHCVRLDGGGGGVSIYIDD